MIVFHFPVYHTECDTCESRFRCMTIKIHKENTKIHEYIPFRVGLMCFKLEPYYMVNLLSLRVSGRGMEIIVNGA